MQAQRGGTTYLQEGARVRLNVPMGQAEQVVALVLEYVPPSQTVQ